MLFICNTTIEPDARDETMARFMEHGVVEPAGAKLQGAWVSVAQQEAWCVLEADSAEAIMAPFDAWGTDLNLHQITPVLDFAGLKSFLEAKD